MHLEGTLCASWCHFKVVNGFPERERCTSNRIVLHLLMSRMYCEVSSVQTSEYTITMCLHKDSHLKSISCSLNLDLKIKYDFICSLVFTSSSNIVRTGIVTCTSVITRTHTIKMHYPSVLHCLYIRSSSSVHPVNRYTRHSYHLYTYLLT